MVQSPCNKICTLDADNVCVGCGRSRGEIGAWSQLSDAEKTRVVKKAKERLAALASARRGRQAAAAR